METNKHILSDEALRLGLQQTLLSRIRRNPRYSLRTFAQSLGVDASLLSKVLRKQRPVGRNFRHRVLSVLDSEDLGVSRHATYRTVMQNEFLKVAEWYHYAIMELCLLEGFTEDPMWIAAKLGISPAEAAIGWRVLVEGGYVVRDKNGPWRLPKENPTTVGQAPTSAKLRRMQKDILAKAIHALETFPAEQRDQSTMTMAIRSDLLPEAKARIKQFRRDMCAFLQEEGGCDAVYNLTISLYPLTKPKRKHTS